MLDIFNISIFRKEKKMTKKLSLILLLVLVCSLLLTACDNTPNPGTDSGSDSDTSTSAPSDSGSESDSESESTTPDLSTSDLGIVVDGIAEYKVIRSESASTAASTSANLVYNAIIEATGVRPDFSDDYILRGQEPKPEDKEILIGITNRDESQEAFKDLPYGEYLIKKVGAKLVVIAWDDNSLFDACQKLAAHIKSTGEKDSLTISKDYTLSGTGVDMLKDLPTYDSESFKGQIVDLADESYMFYLEGTNKAEFDAYLKKLENEGYKQFARKETKECIFTTYTSDKYVINTTYTGFENNVRVTIDNSYDMSIFEKTEYTKVCEPSVTMVGLETYKGSNNSYKYNQIGLFLIFRLEDGRFIIVDGGGYTSYLPKVIYENLQNLAVDKNNITVAAWIFTHAHGDHTGAFIQFANSSYKSKVNVENFIFNFTTYSQYEGISDGADHGRADQTRETIASKYPKSTVVKVHTGQVLQAADVEMEFLYTFDDILPANLTYHNTTSLVFRYKSNGYTVMCLGDAYTVTSKRLVKMYGDYLKSDMVQIAHHGYVGGTNELYKNIAATVNIWPGGVEAFGGKRNLSGESYNKYALSLKSVKETYVAGNKVFTFAVPYTPDPNNQNTLIKGE